VRTAGLRTAACAVHGKERAFRRERGKNALNVFHQFPLSPALSPLVPRGARGKKALNVVAEHSWRPPIPVRQVVSLGRSSASLLPLLPKKGGEGRGEEAVFHQFPLSPALSPLVPRGERGKKPSAFFVPNTIGLKPALRHL